MTTFRYFSNWKYRYEEAKVRTTSQGFHWSPSSQMVNTIFVANSARFSSEEWRVKIVNNIYDLFFSSLTEVFLRAVLRTHVHKRGEVWGNTKWLTTPKDFWYIWQPEEAYDCNILDLPLPKFWNFDYLFSYVYYERFVSGFVSQLLSGWVPELVWVSYRRWHLMKNASSF